MQNVLLGMVLAIMLAGYGRDVDLVKTNAHMTDVQNSNKEKAMQVNEISVVSTSPENGETNVWGVKEATIRFDKPIRDISDEITVEISEVGSTKKPIKTGVSFYATRDDKVHFYIEEYLESGKTYKVTVKGNTEYKIKPYEFTFTTAK